MTKEESINRLNNVVKDITNEALVTDLLYWKDDFIDFCDDAISNSEKESLFNDKYLIGVSIRVRGLMNLLFYKNDDMHPAYTKTIQYKEYEKRAKSIRRTELIDKMLKNN